jgi:hypothetical protein
MSRSKTKLGRAVIFASMLALPSLAQAQGWYHQGNYGNRSQTNWQVQGGIHAQNPGAAVVGGLLTGIGRGLHAENPQRHAVASNVLGGLGGGMMIASQPTYWQQGSVQHINQGWHNQQGGIRSRGNGGWGGAQPRPIYNRPAWTNQRPW